MGRYSFQIRQWLVYKGAKRLSMGRKMLELVEFIKLRRFDKGLLTTYKLVKPDEIVELEIKLR